MGKILLPWSPVMRNHGSNRRSYAPSAGGSLPTFADATMYASSTVIYGAGSGTSGDPYNLLDALENRVSEGTLLGAYAGIYVGVAPSGDPKWSSAFMPAVGGVTVVAQYPSATTANSALHSVLKSGATTAFTGWPAFGALGTGGVKWIGFASDNNDGDNQAITESGTVVFRSSADCELHLCKLGGATGYSGNYSGVRVELSDRFVSEDMLIDGYANGGQANKAGVILYKSNNVSMGHWTVTNCLSAAQIKGSDDGVTHTIYALDLYQWDVDSCTNAFRLHGPVKGPSGELNYIRQSLIKNTARIVELTTSSTHVGEQDGLRIFNNTARNLTGDAAIWLNNNFSEGVRPRDNQFFNNIIDVSPYYWAKYYAGYTGDFLADFMQCDRNILHSIPQPFNGSTGEPLDSLTLAQWQSIYGQDLNSLTDDPLLNADGSLQGGSPAIGLGRDRLNIFGGGIDSVINAGAFGLGQDAPGVRGL